jgi:hypothetical protein
VYRDPVVHSLHSFVQQDRHDCTLELQLTMQSVPITTNVVSLNPTRAIQHYVIKFVRLKTEILLKVALNQLNQSFVQMRNEIYACSEIVAQFHY